MHRESFVLQLKDGMQDEYKRRHDEIWPEMLQMLQAAGIRNYSIWLSGSMLFGYYECDDIQKADAVKKGSPVHRRWSEYMKDIISPVALRSTGNQPELVFMME